MTMTKSAAQALIQQAFEAAARECDSMIEDNPGQWYPCGFASVVIRPARGPVVAALKDLGIGSKAYGGGYSVWNPSKNPTQWMDAKYEGAKVFAQVLQAHGIDAQADCRMD